MWSMSPTGLTVFTQTKTVIDPSSACAGPSAVCGRRFGTTPAVFLYLSRPVYFWTRMGNTRQPEER